MSFIKTISQEEASGDLHKMYQSNYLMRGYLPNYVRAFSHRPKVMMAWGKLIGSIRDDMDLRRYGLVTLAAANALRSSYCMLAHASLLQQADFSDEQLTQIATGEGKTADLTPAELAMMAYAEKLVHGAASITQADIESLRQHGLSDGEIFEIAAVAAARCFFSKTLDALGTEPDSVYLDIGEELRQSLSVGRPIASQSE